MKSFNHSDSSEYTPSQLAKQWNCSLHSVLDTECYPSCGVKAAYILGTTYGPLSSWGRILKMYLNLLEMSKPGTISALLAHRVFIIYKADGTVKYNIVVREQDKEKLKQPSAIGDTGYYYDTFTDSKNSLEILRKVIKLTDTVNQLIVYVRQRR